MPQVKVNKTFLSTFLTSPQDVLNQLNLIYTTDEVLTIQRIKQGKKFIYKRRGRSITNKRRLERFESMVIPPAWHSVKISHIKNAHILALGRDEKNRKQYIYHPVWKEIRNQTKFYKLYEFGNILPKIRKTVEVHLRDKVWTKNKVSALVIRLLEETHIRIGNKFYANKNKTYGLSTFRSKHVDVYKDGLVFEFVGKKGKEHRIPLKNKKLIKLVNQCEEIPGWELFKYYDEQGEKQVFDSGMVNRYIHDISEDYFTAKDFRTWSATVICFETLKKIGIKENKKKRDKKLIKAIDKVAKSLGNTRSVSRNYYIHPVIMDSYENKTIQKAFEYADSIKKNTPHFSASEAAVMKLIKNYRPKITA